MALQIAPLIVAERWILISLYLFMAGIILFHLLPPIWHRGEYLDWLLGGSLLVSIAELGAAINARHFAGHDWGLLCFDVRGAGQCVSRFWHGYACGFGNFA